MITKETVEQIIADLDKGRSSLQYASLIHNSYKVGEQNGWVMDEQAIIGLTAHMLALIDRLERKTPLSEPIDREVATQIDESAMRLAKKVLMPIFQQYGASADTSEIVLVALHFAAAKERLDVS